MKKKVLLPAPINLRMEIHLKKWLKKYSKKLNFYSFNRPLNGNFYLVGIVFKHRIGTLLTGVLIFVEDLQRIEEKNDLSFAIGYFNVVASFPRLFVQNCWLAFQGFKAEDGISRFKIQIDESPSGSISIPKSVFNSDID